MGIDFDILLARARVDMLVALYLTVIAYHLPIISCEPQDLQAFAPAAKITVKDNGLIRRTSSSERMSNRNGSLKEAEAKPEGLCMS